MLMYKCDYCNHEFIEPDYEEEVIIHDEIGQPNREVLRIEVCPQCGSQYLDEGIVCEFCGERFATYETECYCGDCLNLVGEQASALCAATKSNWKSVQDLICAWASLQ